MSYVRKMTPVPIDNLPGTQAWLEDLAAQGLFLVKYRPSFCTFRREAPAQVRYRLEAVRWNDGEIPCELSELTQEMGWEYLGNAGTLFYIFLCRDPQAPELNTDPLTQLPAAKKLRRRMVWNGVIQLILPFALLLLFLRPGSWVQVVLDDSAVFGIPMVLLLFLVCIPEGVRSLRWSGWLVRHLQAGEPVPTRGPYRRGRFSWLHPVSYVLLTLSLAALMFCNYALPILMRDTGPLEECPVAYPLMTQVYPGAEYRENYVIDGIDYARFYSRSFLPLSPMTVEVSQRGEYPGWDDWAGLTYTCYDFILPGLAQPVTRYLAQDTQERWNRDDHLTLEDIEMGAYRHAPWTLTQLSIPGADLALSLTGEDPNSGMLFLCQGNRVCTLHYYSYGDEPPQLDDLSFFLQAS